MKFYVCKHCGKVITILNNVNVPTICCGAPMEELKANTVDAAVEKHVPFVTTVGSEIVIKVGEEKEKPEYVKEFLNQKNRSIGGKTAPAEGLYLTNIKYKD